MALVDRDATVIALDSALCQEAVFKPNAALIHPEAKGAFGRVHPSWLLCGWTASPGAQLCAVKIAHDGRDAFTAMQNEVDVLTHLGNHPSIIRLYGHFILDGMLQQEACMFLELGEIDVLTYINKKRAGGALNEQEVVWFGSQIAAGLTHCHSKFIAHLDVKPENTVLVGTCVKLIDFGCATRMDRNREVQFREHLLGTPEFAGPELYRRTTFDGGAADVWSLGVSMFHLAFTIQPFPSNVDPGTRYSILGKGSFCQAM